MRDRIPAIDELAVMNARELFFSFVMGQVLIGNKYDSSFRTKLLVLMQFLLRAFFERITSWKTQNIVIWQLESSAWSLETEKKSDFTVEKLSMISWFVA